jgi:hypothetical protein
LKELFSGNNVVGEVMQQPSFVAGTQERDEVGVSGDLGW